MCILGLSIFSSARILLGLTFTPLSAIFVNVGSGDLGRGLVCSGYGLVLLMGLLGVSLLYNDVALTHTTTQKQCCTLLGP